MKHTDDQLATQLPEGLRRQFAEVERRLWFKETVVAVCGLLCALGLSYAVLYLSDRVWDTPRWLRGAITVLGLSVLLGFAARWFRLWVWRRRDLRAFASLVQKHYRRLGDRLLGIVELADEQRRPPNMSPSLCRAAIRQVADEAGQFDFGQAINPRQTKLYFTALLVVLLPLLAAWLLAPQAGWNTLQRWLAPAARIDRFTFVTLDQLPARLVVPHGEPFEFSCVVRYRGFWHPARAQARIDQQAPLESAVEGNAVRFRLPAQTREGVLTVRVGDHQKTVRIVPTHRPSLKGLTAAIQLPAYLKYPRLEERIRGGSLTVLEGSEVRLKGEVNRPLLSASLRLEGQSPTALEVDGPTFQTAAIGFDDPPTAAFTWRDKLGLGNGAPWLLTLKTVKDFAPRVDLPGLSSETAILESDILPIKMAAEDDYGVREVGLRWELVGVVDAGGQPIRREFAFGGASPQKKKTEETYLLSPSLQYIPADTILEVRGLATDYFPNRPPAESAVYRIHVIGLVRHAELLRQQLESLFARLEEITRNEESIAAKTGELKDLPREKLATEEAARQAGEQAENQERNARTLEDVSREGSKALLEAMRNPTFSEDTLRDWNRTLQSMQSLSKGEMQKAAQSLQQARQSSDQRSDSLASAEKSEKEALRQLEEMQKRMNAGLDNLQAQTLAQRLRKLAGEENGIAGKLLKIVPETIGLLPKELPDRHRKATANLSDDQGGVREEAQKVHGEMSRFFDRTQRPNYGEVSQEMKASNIQEELERVRGLIQANTSMDAMQNLGSWEKRFQDWAERLEPKTKGGSGSGSGEGSTPQDDLMRMLMSFLRMRQQEANLQGRTRLLEERKAADEKYSETARELAAAQKKLREDLRRVEKENGVPQLTQPIEETHAAMREVESLLNKPQTDTTTDQGQTKTVELLTDLINLVNEQSQRNQNSQSSARQEMEFLMQMVQQQQQQQGMGMQPGQQPGGNLAGGTTDRRSGPLAGDARGSKPDARGIPASSGQTRVLPTEFRQALESYFKAVEQMNE